MDDLAPEIFRQRLLVEGHYRAALDAAAVEGFLPGLARAMKLTPYGQAVVHAPGGRGQEINQGFDAFLPLVDSGIAAYFWSGPGFFSIVVYSCAPFVPQAALDFCREALDAQGPLAWKEF
ncbi:MAG: S-adenosylmethionine decarboxylase [Desulfarculaceae bacterium]|nr:S-adenosylmethionine decarboxylase [Desulfarculaceae bacterium]MCF8048331.1 S-adenosylmethionine decarboxylase [Desulfarculaceae bacterium]MCF8064839.1 S-adenosylmethionine decarboxylase [Desulfarculaceae bacterium]MCF8099665.1 S-adenosylmethionine decarboxylase [Desulfarculaceae bacterium]MCF8123500.1 S-adenosylmethionine decarboxylase [Desulfarculaceae bacterium]